MNFYAISALVNFITSSVLGIFILSKSKNSKNVSFFILCFFIAFWSFFYFLWQISKTSEAALFWIRVFMGGSIFIPVAYLHFVYALVEILDKRKKFLIFSYFLFFIFLLADFTPLFVSHVEPALRFKFWPMPGPVYNLFLVVWFFYVIYPAYLLFKKYKASTGIVKLQIRYVIISMVIGFVGGSTNYFLWYRIPIPPVGNILVLVVVATGYAIIRYRLLDIRIIARKTFIYFGIAAFAYSIFYLLTWIYNSAFGSVYSLAAYLTGVLVVPLVVLAFYAIDKGLRIFANRHLFASLYNYQETINKLADELNYYIDLDKIVSLIVETIKKTMQLDRAGVLLINTETNPTHYQIAKIIGFNRQNGISLVRDSFLTKYLQKTQKPLVRDELALLSRDTNIKKDKQSFDRLFERMKHFEASLCLPLMSSKKLLGIIVLGAKISGDAYTQEDLELLNTMSKQAGIAIENAMLYKQVHDFNKTLQDKVDEQTKDIRTKNDEIKEKNKYLKELLEMKSDFLRVVNHQLNTPLSVMNGYFSMMDEGSYSTDKAIPSIKAGLERINSTVADFWEAYELEGERMKIQPQKTNITEIVERLLPEKQKMQLARERKLTMEVQKPNFEIPVVWCDYKKITHVISNLLDNAVYYTSKGRVTVSYELVNDNYLKINVKDTGVGITEKDKKKLFQKFFRGQNATDLRPDGSGLGLFIAKKIVEGNFGEITCSSEGKDKGSTFSFTLPIFKSQQTDVSQEKLISRKKIVRFKKV